MPKQILVVQSRIPSNPKDGGALAANQTLHYLHEAGYTIDLLSLNTTKHYVDPKGVQHHFPFVKQYQTVTINTKLSVWGALRSIFSGQSYNISRFCSKEWDQALRTMLQNNNYAFLYFEGLYATTPLFTITPEEIGIPIIIRVHNIEHQIWQRLSETTGNYLKKIFLQTMYKRLKKEEQTLLSKAHHLLHIAPTDLKYFQELLPNIKHSYMPFGAETVSGTSTRTQPMSIGFIGSMEWVPNVEGLTWFISRVLPQIRSELPNVVMHIAGKSLHTVPKQLFEGKNVHILGEVASSQKFMQSVSVLIVPLFAGSGVRIKTLEALAIGTPVVTTPIGIQGIAAQHNHSVCIAENEKDFSACVISILKNPELRSQLIEHGKHYIEAHHSKASVVAQLQDLTK